MEQVQKLITSQLVVYVADPLFLTEYSNSGKCLEINAATEMCGVYYGRIMAGEESQCVS
jgi:hypothetical protein